MGVSTYYFNPRSREGSDIAGIVSLRWEWIISIHAPVKGATGCGPSCRRTCSHFNPRSREGSDQLQRQTAVEADISIHAPVKGATHQAYALQQAERISIHAPVKGATLGAEDGARQP